MNETPAPGGVLRPASNEGTFPRLGGMITRTTITEDELESRGTGGEGLHVLVISPEIFGAVPLPERGSVLVGRSAKAEVLIEDPLASRQHARLSLGDGLSIE